MDEASYRSGRHADGSPVPHGKTLREIELENILAATQDAGDRRVEELLHANNGMRDERDASRRTIRVQQAGIEALTYSLALAEARIGLPAYVVGLAFTPDRSRVVLIEKRRPAWMLGLLNGPGGKIERGESAAEAMAREFREETGVTIPLEQWEPVATLACLGSHVVHFFAAFSEVAWAAETVEEERVALLPVAGLVAYGCVPVLPVVISLALDVGIMKPVVLTDLSGWRREVVGEMAAAVAA